MRTREERERIARECLKIERAGGDVLEYLKTEMHSYTPRATWINLQKEILGRDDARLTDGRKKWGNEMKRNESQKDTVLGIINCMENGRNIGQYLIDRGFLNPESTFDNAKLYAKRNMPDEYEKIKDLKASKVCRSEQTETRTKREHRKTEIRHEASPSCCQPAKPSGVTVPDELPEEPEDTKLFYPIGREEMRFKVKQITSNLGVWEYNDKAGIAFSARDFNGERLNVMILDTKGWLNLAAEIPEAIKALTKDIN